jgi:hypothetical protein
VRGGGAKHRNLLQGLGWQLLLFFVTMSSLNSFFSSVSSKAQAVSMVWML